MTTVGPTPGRAVNPTQTTKVQTKPVRRPQDVLDDLAGDGISEATSSPAEKQAGDPARIAMRILLKRALDEAHTDASQAGADGVTIVVIVADPLWASVARDEWGSLARQGRAHYDGHMSYFWSDRPTWIAWTVAADDIDAVRDEFGSIPKAIADNRHCAGFATDMKLLPQDLVQAADYILALPALTAADVTSIAEQTCEGRVSKHVDQDLATALTPRLLRLAYRKRYDASAYIRKLQEVCSKESAAPEPVSVTNTSVEQPRLDQLHGMEAAVAWGRQLARDVAAFREGGLRWSDIDHACLLTGPPGTGKSTFAQALAATCGLHLLQGSYAIWMATRRGHQGDLLRSMAETFQDARENAPALICLDEFDSFPDRDTLSDGHPEWHVQLVNALLAELDLALAHPGIVIVAACNDGRQLDPALVRSGRLGTRFAIALPDSQALALIMREHLRSGELDETSLEAPALLATGLSGADVARAVQGARRRARIDGRPMAIDDLRAEITGEELSPEDMDVVALYAAGKAMALEVLWPGRLECVALRRLENGIVRKSAVYVRKREDFDNELICLLAGRAAEAVMLGEASSLAGGGTESDLALATKLAVAAVGSYGLDRPSVTSSRADGWSGSKPSREVVWHGAPEDSRGMLLTNRGLSMQVSVLLATAYADAVTMMKARRRTLASLKEALLAQRALSGPAVAKLVGVYH